MRKQATEDNLSKEPMNEGISPFVLTDTMARVPSEAFWTVAGVPAREVDTRTAVETRPRLTLVQVLLTQST